jgi:hypothetical protein
MCKHMTILTCSYHLMISLKNNILSGYNARKCNRSFLCHS